MDARVGLAIHRGPRGIAAGAAALWLALCLASSPAAAVDEPWRGDFEVDMALGTLDDPSLIQVLTEDPAPGDRLGAGQQPFNQQPSAAQDDFDQPAEPGQRDPHVNPPPD